MTTTNGSGWQEMLVLAGLTYRGGVVHGSLVGGAVEQGLAALAPDWTRVWGPSASHLLGDPLDACAMYVVQHRAERERYVVAVRGTNPLAISDWVFGDFDVGSTVAWPFASDGAALSKSTAFGLKWLLGLPWSAGSFVERAAEDVAARWELSPSLLAIVRRSKPLADLAAGARGTNLSLVQKTLRSWQRDDAFAGIREQAALARLPQAERQEWSGFWSDVDNWLQKSGGPK